MKKIFWGTGAALVAAIFMADGTFATAQETKQLKEIDPSHITAVTETPDTEATPADNSDGASDGTNDAATDADGAVPDNADAGLASLLPGGNVQSYSVVTENRVGPDGKRVQRKKVWKNGTLVQDEEKTVEGDDAEEDLSVELDGQVLPGTISRSERNGNCPLDAFGNIDPDADMSEVMKQMEKTMREQQARYAEFMKRFGGGANFPGGFFAMPNRGGPSGFSAASIPLSEYWIGASVTPVPPELAYQLDLPEGEGLFIREIVPGSPAEKAGLAQFDILTKIDEETVNSMEQIGQLVDQAGETQLAIEFLRKGKANQVELTPEKRPNAEMNSGLDLSSETDADTPQREQIRVVRPGMIVPSEQDSPVSKTDAEKAVPGESTENATETPASISTDTAPEAK